MINERSNYGVDKREIKLLNKRNRNEDPFSLDFLVNEDNDEEDYREYGDEIIKNMKKPNKQVR